MTLEMPGPTIAQQLYNLTARRLEEEYFEFSREHVLFTMVYNPLAGGLLSGRHKFDVGPTEGRFALSSLAETYRNRYWDPRIFAAVDAFGRIAAEEGMALPELALRWVASSTDVGSILLGASRLEQLEDNIAALAKGPLPASAITACDEVCKSLRGPMPKYNR
jgi:aryl-alcohol dehydrogenase-like predicted oxidoreductase